MLQEVSQASVNWASNFQARLNVSSSEKWLKSDIKRGTCKESIESSEFAIATLWFRSVYMCVIEQGMKANL